MKSDISNLRLPANEELLKDRMIVGTINSLPHNEIIFWFILTSLFMVIKIFIFNIQLMSRKTFFYKITSSVHPSKL